MLCLRRAFALNTRIHTRTIYWEFRAIECAHESVSFHWWDVGMWEGATRKPKKKCFARGPSHDQKDKNRCRNKGAISHHKSRCRRDRSTVRTLYVSPTINHIESEFFLLLRKWKSIKKYLQWFFSFFPSSSLRSLSLSLRSIWWDANARVNSQSAHRYYNYCLKGNYHCRARRAHCFFVFRAVSFSANERRMETKRRSKRSAKMAQDATYQL